MSGADAGGTPPTATTPATPTAPTTVPDALAPLPDAEVNGDAAVPALLDAAPDGAVLIDGAPLDASRPMPTCRAPAVNANAFNLRCSANASNPTPGGRVLNGTYVLNGGYGALMCPSTFIFGYAEVFSELGEQFIRYYALKRATTTDVGVSVSGTYWLNYDSTTGRLRAEEMCDPVRKGVVRTGEVAVAGTQLTLTFVNGQERWDKK